MDRVVKTTEVTKRDLAATSDEVKRTAKEVSTVARHANWHRADSVGGASEQ